MAFIPHTEKDIAEMLAAIGVGSIEQLFDEIPFFRQHFVQERAVHQLESLAHGWLARSFAFGRNKPWRLAE